VRRKDAATLKAAKRRVFEMSLLDQPDGPLHDKYSDKFKESIAR
jgi:hypothetical protein